jgi:hypothetical protein
MHKEVEEIESGTVWLKYWRGWRRENRTDRDRFEPILKTELHHAGSSKQVSHNKIYVLEIKS